MMEPLSFSSRIAARESVFYDGTFVIQFSVVIFSFRFWKWNELVPVISQHIC